MHSEAIRQLTRVHIELTNDCNCACAFCARPRMTRPVVHMNSDLAKRLMSEISAMHLSPTVTFHVLGEPCLHPDFLGILRFAARTGLRTSLVTNGTLLGTDLGEQLRYCPQNQLTVSVQTPDEMSFSFRKAPLSFAEYRKGILSFLVRTYAEWSECRYVFRFLSTSFLEKTRGCASLYGKVCSDFSDQRMAMYTWAGDIYSAIRADGQAVAAALARLNSVELGITNRIWIHDRIRFDVWHMLEWVDWSRLPNAAEVSSGDCYYRKDHIAILSNGDVVLCNLDFDGRTVLGNVSDATVAEVLCATKAEEVFCGFARGRLVMPYCRRCMASWQSILRALGPGTTPANAQRSVMTILENKCSIW